MLGQNAFTVASHLTMVAILIMLIARIVSHRTGQLGAAIGIMAVGMIIERLYYVLARFLAPLGVNLWQLHPAPEVLSMVVATGAYGVMVPLIWRSYHPQKKAVQRMCFEVAALSALWGLTVWGLY